MVLISKVLTTGYLSSTGYFTLGGINLFDIYYCRSSKMMGYRIKFAMIASLQYVCILDLGKYVYKTIKNKEEN